MKADEKAAAVSDLSLLSPPPVERAPALLFSTKYKKGVGQAFPGKLRTWGPQKRKREVASPLSW